MTQGDPLTIITYGIGILSLINNLKQEIPDVTQPWYADDAGDLGAFTRLETYFDLLIHQCLGQEYHPKPSKSILILRPYNIEAGKVSVARHGFKVCKGARYLRGYIMDDKSKCNCMRERTLTWEKNISTIRKIGGKYSQESYAAVVRVIQLE